MINIQMKVKYLLWRINEEIEMVLRKQNDKCESLKFKGEINATIGYTLSMSLYKNKNIVYASQIKINILAQYTYYMHLNGSDVTALGGC